MTVQLEPLISVNDAARLLAVSRNTVWRLIRDGQLPVVSLVGRTLIKPTDLRDFISARTENRSRNDDDRAVTRSPVRSIAAGVGERGAS